MLLKQFLFNHQGYWQVYSSHQPIDRVGLDCIMSISEGKTVLFWLIGFDWILDAQNWSVFGPGISKESLNSTLYSSLDWREHCYFCCFLSTNSIEIKTIPFQVKYGTKNCVNVNEIHAETMSWKENLWFTFFFFHVYYDEQIK